MPGGPMPPDMHWALVLVLSWISFGLGAIVWSFKQANFVKKIDPASKAVTLLAVILIGMVVQVILVFGAARSSMTAMALASSITMLLNLVIIVLSLVTVFSMRKSIETYYNTTEPIGLKLSGIMTFFFSILYFQHHFSRIAAWKKSGRLL